MSKTLKRGRFCVLIGFILLLAAGGFWLYNNWEDAQANKAANALLFKVQQKIPNASSEPNQSSESGTIKIGADTLTSIDNSLGILKIPSLGLTLPVQRKYTLDALRTSPCQFTNGGRLERLIICGHNFATHFGKIGTLSKGDAITLTDMGGHTYNFSVSEVLTVEPNDWNALKTGNWDLTLFTCTVGGLKRVLVRSTLNP